MCPYAVRVYVGDQYARDNIQVAVEGATPYNIANLAAYQWDTTVSVGSSGGRLAGCDDPGPGRGPVLGAQRDRHLADHEPAAIRLQRLAVLPAVRFHRRDHQRPKWSGGSLGAFSRTTTPPPPTGPDASLLRDVTSEPSPGGPEHSRFPGSARGSRTR